LSVLIGTLNLDSGFDRNTQEVIIPIRYDGEDLAQVAELQGLSIADLILKHHQITWDVAFIGFAPGFAYMSSLDQPFTDIPRLKTPRKKIPSGSLGLAGQYSGIYPKDSPGGWQLIGTTSEKMWDLERQNPALLRPGMRVHFEDVTHHPVSVDVPKDCKFRFKMKAVFSTAISVWVQQGRWMSLRCIVPIESWGIQRIRL
jgi:allophanate hydrolase